MDPIHPDIIKYAAYKKALGLVMKDTVGLVQPDNVNSPSHYNKHGIEAIMAIKASMSSLEYKGYLKGNVLKYVWRYAYKNGLEDLLKAQWYLNKLIEELKNEK